MYANNICTSSEILSFILFADDTNLFLSHKDLKILSNTMDQEFGEGYIVASGKQIMNH